LNETVKSTLDQLFAALEAAADAEGNSIAELNAYFAMEQEVRNAANHCTQSLYWAKKKEDKQS